MADDTAEDPQECGYEDTTTGEPCSRTTGLREDGRCFAHTEVDDENPGGRPTYLESLTEVERTQLMSDLADVIENGGSIREACNRADLHPETFYSQLERGEADKLEGNDDTIHAKFHERLTRAIGNSEGMYRQAILKIAIQTNDLETLLTMLKQRHPESWGQTNRGEQTGGNLDVTIKDSVVEGEAPTIEVDEVPALEEDEIELDVVENVE